MPAALGVPQQCTAAAGQFGHRHPGARRRALNLVVLRPPRDHLVAHGTTSGLAGVVA